MKDERVHVSSFPHASPTAHVNGGHCQNGSVAVLPGRI